MSRISSNNVILVHAEQGKDVKGEMKVSETGQKLFNLVFLQLTTGEIINFWSVPEEQIKGLQIAIPKDTKQFSIECDQFKTKTGGIYNKILAIRPMA